MSKFEGNDLAAYLASTPEPKTTEEAEKEKVLDMKEEIQEEKELLNR